MVSASLASSSEQDAETMTVAKFNLTSIGSVDNSDLDVPRRRSSEDELSTDPNLL